MKVEPGMKSGAICGMVALLLLCGGCSDESSNDDPYARGQLVYKNVCIACHNPDPSQPGALGPAIAGASRELVEHRVLHGTYPAGYEPQRNSKTMPQFPHLEGSIDDLVVFLNSGGDGDR